MSNCGYQIIINNSYLRLFWLCLLPFFLGSVLRACCTLAPDACSFVVRGRVCWRECSSSSCDICCHDICPAAAERTFFSFNPELDFERLSNIFLNKHERISAKFWHACSSLLGTLLCALSSSFQSLLVGIVMMSFLTKMPVWYWHLQVRKSVMVTQLEMQFVHVSKTMPPLFVLIIGQQQAYCYWGNLVQRGILVTTLPVNSFILCSKLEL